jgi:hypothetical protein
MAIDGGAKSQDTCTPHARHGFQTGGLSNGVYELSSKQSIAELAYHLWNARGRPHGSEEEDWLEAERRLAAAKQADRDGGGREETADATPKGGFPARDPAAAARPVDSPPSNAADPSEARSKKGVAGKRPRSAAKSTSRSATVSASTGKAGVPREVSTPPVDETDDAPRAAPRDIGEG